MFSTLDRALEMERKFRTKDPKLLLLNPSCSRYGPIEVCAILQEVYSKIFADKYWLVLASNLICQTNLGIKSGFYFECGSENYRNKCSTLGRDKDPVEEKLHQQQHNHSQDGNEVNRDSKICFGSTYILKILTHPKRLMVRLGFPYVLYL